jgi:hypothetical protein
MKFNVEKTKKRKRKWKDTLRQITIENTTRIAPLEKGFHEASNTVVETTYPWLSLMLKRTAWKVFWFYVYFTDSKKFQAFYLQKFQIEQADQAFYTLRNYFLYVCTAMLCWGEILCILTDKWHGFSNIGPVSHWLALGWAVNGNNGASQGTSVWSLVFSYFIIDFSLVGSVP